MWWYSGTVSVEKWKSDGGIERWNSVGGTVWVEQWHSDGGTV